MRVVRAEGVREFDAFVDAALDVVHASDALLSELAPAVVRLRDAAKRCVDAGVFVEVES